GEHRWTRPAGRGGQRCIPPPRGPSDTRRGLPPRPHGRTWAVLAAWQATRSREQQLRIGAIRRPPVGWPALALTSAGESTAAAASPPARGLPAGAAARSPSY